MKCKLQKFVLYLIGFSYIYQECFGMRKRFLATTPTFCFPISWHCRLNCANGYQTGANKCPVCRCAPSGGSSVITSTSTQGNSYTPARFYSNPCDPSTIFCPLVCTYGFALGRNGCRYCKCATRPSPNIQPAVTTPVTSISTLHLTTINTLTPTTVPMTTKLSSILITMTTNTITKAVFSNPCFATDVACNKTCQYGYLEGPGFCNYCICAPPNAKHHHRPTATSLATTSLPVTSTPSYVPCIHGKGTCGYICKNGYVKGPNNCDYCLCAPDSLVSTAGTDRPKTNNDGNISTTPSSVNATSSPDMSNLCTLAATICQLKCKDGFIIDAHHCTHCICKDDVYKAVGVTVTDEPLIKIMNPCVKGLDLCRIFCARGYLRGPERCQFCACRN